MLAVSLLTSCPGDGGTPGAGQPPPTRTDTTATTFHGVRVADPYRWLEDGDSPEVQTWISSQNAHTDSILATYSEGAALRTRIGTLARTSPDRFRPSIVGSTLFYMRQTPPQPQPVLVTQAWPTGDARVLLDVNAAGGRVAITGYWPSPSGRYIAYTTASGGSEFATLRFLDTRSAKMLPDSLPYAGGGTSPAAVAWDANERGVTFARFPVPPAGERIREFDVSLFHHALGKPDDAAPALGQGLSHIAEWVLLSGKRQSAALLFRGDGGFADVFIRTDGAWRRVVDESAGITRATLAEDRLLLLATAGAPRGRVVALSADGKMTEVLGEGEWATREISPIAGGILVVRVSGRRWRVDHYNQSGALVRTLALPANGIGVGTLASSSASSEALVTYAGWTTPTTWVRYDGRTGSLTPVFKVTPAADYSRIVSDTLEATSNDGTRVPVTVLSLTGTPQDGSAPAILTGYGGFRGPTAPQFVGTSLAWLERGGVLAYANTRGGNEFGEAWHQAGMKTAKQHVFDDFYAAAQSLVKERWTRADRLGITGASNGGLLVGAALTQHPKAYRAVVSFVGIYDMLRHELFPNGAYNATEYGTTSDSAQFAALYAYSPLHHVQPGVSYPAVLMETGLNDRRVASWQSRKFTAALQASTTSGRPVLLLTRVDAGHGVGAPFSQRVGNAALALTFFAHELGLRADSAR
jgi:prolyl oligopeptidase